MNKSSELKTTRMVPLCDAEEAFLKNIHRYVDVIFMTIDIGDGISCGLAGTYGQKTLQAWDDYKAGKSGRGFGSTGFGYSPETVKAMLATEFPIGPNVVLSTRSYDDVGSSTSEENALTTHLFYHHQKMLEHFGIQCFLGTGGAFPGETNHSLLVINVQDPDFLIKMRPLFLNNFPRQAARNLREPNHQADDHVVQLYRLACLAEVVKLGKEIGADLTQASAALAKITPIIEKMLDQMVEKDDYIRGQVDYQFQFIRPPLKVMAEVLSPAEKADVILSIYGIAAGFELFMDLKPVVKPSQFLLYADNNKLVVPVPRPLC